MSAPTSASASATSATSPAASPSPPSSTHLLYRDVLQSVLSWLPLSEVWPARSVCAGWAAAVRGECDARPLRQKAELSAAMSMLSEEAEVTAGAKRLTRLVRSVPAEDWPRTPLIDDILFVRASLLRPLSSPSAVVATAASVALVTAMTQANVMATFFTDALCTLVCGPTWNDAAALMSVDERAQLCCLLARAGVLHRQSHADRPQMFALLLQCAEGVSQPQLRSLVRSGAMEALCGPLRLAAAASAILPALSALTHLLAMGKSDASSDQRLNLVVDALDQCGGSDAIAALQHHADVSVSQAAVSCVQTFFVYEEDEDPEAENAWLAKFLGQDEGQDEDEEPEEPADHAVLGNLGEDEDDAGGGVDFEQ